ncbi:AAA-ATPase At2g46620 [Linum perenne]
MHLLLAVAAILASTFFLFRLLTATSFLQIVVKSWTAIHDRLHLHQTYRVPQFNPNTNLPNPLYTKVSSYLSSLHDDSASDFTNLLSGPNPSHDIILSLDPRHLLRDRFLGANLSWSNYPSDGDESGRTFVLRLRKKDKRRILRPYLQHILSVSDDVVKEIKLFMNNDVPDEFSGRWRSVPFTHPATMETVVMEADLKSKVRSDLESFLKSKQYYHRLGRVWKRSYLLYGASGTGKSSFVAAMARFLGFDLYDIDISKVRNDSDLKTLLLQTTSRSVIVIEDLDRYLAEKKSNNKNNWPSNSKDVTSLTGVLNFMDGIMSCCGEERVMVFTMSSKEGIDPAVLRPGRIDVHVHFPLCDFPAFKSLASNYLGVKEHKLFPQVEEIIQSGGASLSPAEIGEIMISNRGSPSRALKSVITALQASGSRGANSNENSVIKLLRDSSRSSTATGTAAVAGEEGGGVFCRESVHTVREFRKLYGLLKMGSRRKEENSVSVASLEMGGPGSGPLEKEGKIESGNTKS